MSKRSIDRLLDLARDRGLSQTDLATRLHVSPGVITNWKKRGMPASRLEEVSLLFGVGIEALLGSAQMPKDAMPIYLKGRIPVKGYAKLGDNGHFVDLQYCDSDGDGFIDLPSKDPLAYAVRCSGTSMMPRIQPGEYVVAEPSREALPGDEVVVESNDGKVMVKRFLYMRDGIVFLGSVNEAQDTIMIDEKDIAYIHPVLAIISKQLWKPY